VFFSPRPNVYGVRGKGRPNENDWFWDGSTTSVPQSGSGTLGPENNRSMCDTRQSPIAIFTIKLQ
jgi:hypothetical protein